MNYFTVKNMVRQRDKRKEELRKCRDEHRKKELAHECRRMNARIRAEIERCPDAFVRKMIVLKLRDRRSWGGVAAEVQGGNTEESVRKICVRYEW